MGFCLRVAALSAGVAAFTTAPPTPRAPATALRSSWLEEQQSVASVDAKNVHFTAAEVAARAALDAIRADASLARRPFDDGRENDGIFFMAFGDFVKEFQHVEHVDPPFGGVAQAARAQFLLDQAGRPSAQWRIRPPVESVSRWDVSGLRFFDAAGAEIAPTGAVESGSAADAKYDNNPGWDAHSMLFSGEAGACCGVPWA